MNDNKSYKPETFWVSNGNNLIYNLRENGFRGGDIQYCNDIAIKIVPYNVKLSQQDLNHISKTITDALNTTYFNRTGPDFQISEQVIVNNKLGTITGIQLTEVNKQEVWKYTIRIDGESPEYISKIQFIPTDIERPSK